jgi:hypothetical protein
MIDRGMLSTAPLQKFDRDFLGLVSRLTVVNPRFLVSFSPQWRVRVSRAHAQRPPDNLPQNPRVMQFRSELTKKRGVDHSSCVQSGQVAILFVLHAYIDCAPVLITHTFVVSINQPC